MPPASGSLFVIDESDEVIKLAPFVSWLLFVGISEVSASVPAVSGKVKVLSEVKLSKLKNPSIVVWPPLENL